MPENRFETDPIGGFIFKPAIPAAMFFCEAKNY